MYYVVSMSALRKCMACTHVCMHDADAHVCTRVYTNVYAHVCAHGSEAPLKSGTSEPSTNDYYAIITHMLYWVP